MSKDKPHKTAPQIPLKSKPAFDYTTTLKCEAAKTHIFAPTCFPSLIKKVYLRMK